MAGNHRLILLVFLAAVLMIGFDAWAADREIKQAGQKFNPSSISIKIGERVIFHNEDDVTHNISVIDAEGEPEDQGLQKPGEDITKKFDAAGHYTVRCQIHPRMKMSIDVN